jgi:hypothetical protein
MRDKIDKQINKLYNKFMSLNDHDEEKTRAIANYDRYRGIIHVCDTGDSYLSDLIDKLKRKRNP